MREALLLLEDVGAPHMPAGLLTSISAVGLCLLLLEASSTSFLSAHCQGPYLVQVLRLCLIVGILSGCVVLQP